MHTSIFVVERMQKTALGEVIRGNVLHEYFHHAMLTITKRKGAGWRNQPFRRGLGVAFTVRGRAAPSCFLPIVTVCPALLCGSGVLHNRRREQNQRGQQTDQKFDDTQSPHPLPSKT